MRPQREKIQQSMTNVCSQPIYWRQNFVVSVERFSLPVLSEVFSFESSHNRRFRIFRIAHGSQAFDVWARSRLAGHRRF